MEMASIHAEFAIRTIRTETILKFDYKTKLMYHTIELFLVPKKRRKFHEDHNKSFEGRHLS